METSARSFVVVGSVAVACAATAVFVASTTGCGSGPAPAAAAAAPATATTDTPEPGAPRPPRIPRAALPDGGSTRDSGVTGVTIPMGNSWYVTPSGTPGGDGSMSNPWDIVTALNGPAAVQPGDTIWVRAGKYGGGTSSSVIASHLIGTAALPILVRAYPGERATIDAWLQVGCCDGAPDPTQGSYTWFWGLEFAGFNTDRTSGTSGPPEWAAQANHPSADTWGAGTKFIDNIIHDTSGGLSVWNAADTELYGNIVYNVGGYGTDRGHGHDFYLQNTAPSVIEVTDNIGFDNFDMGVQAYGSSDASVQNITLRGNVVFNSGILYYGQPVDNVTIGGGTDGPSGIVVHDNFFYDTPSLDLGYNELGFLWTARSHDVVITNNFFIGGQQSLDLERWDTLTYRDNTVYADSQDESMLILRDDQTTSGYSSGKNHYYGSGQFRIYTGCDDWPCPSSPQVVDFAGWQSATGLDSTSTFEAGAPTGTWVRVRRNVYDPGRANVVVFNWDMRPSVRVDLSRAGIKVGDSFQIRDAEDWDAGPVASGTYGGAPVRIPMSGLTVVQPVGTVPYAPSHTAPQFGVFVVLSGQALKNAY